MARSNDHETVIGMLNKGKVDNKPSVPVSDYFGRRYDPVGRAYREDS